MDTENSRRFRAASCVNGMTVGDGLATWLRPTTQLGFSVRC